MDSSKPGLDPMSAKNVTDIQSRCVSKRVVVVQTSVSMRHVGKQRLSRKKRV